MATVDQKEVLEECIKELKVLEGKKRDRILKLAEDLAKHNMKKKEICAEICKAFRESEIKHLVTDSYIRYVLPKEYKDDSKTRTEYKEENKPQVEKALLTVQNNGKQITEKETPLSDTARFKQIVTENVNLKAENQQFKAMAENKLPIVTDLQKHGFNLTDKHPHYYKGSAQQILKMLTEEIGKDKNADHQYRVLLMRVSDKIGSTKTVPV